MTESGWLESKYPDAMLAFLREAELQTDRKFRLFSCACVRRVRRMLTDERSQLALEVAERYADHLASQEELAAAHADAERALQASIPILTPEDNYAHLAMDAVRFASILNMPSFPDLVSTRAGAAFAQSLVQGVEESVQRGVWDEAFRREMAAQALLLRELFGPLPFRHVPIESRFLTANGGLISSLALAAYEHRQLPQGTLEPERLLVLADAVEEGGGADQEVLTHLRSPGQKVRGDWALDILLNKD